MADKMPVAIYKNAIIHKITLLKLTWVMFVYLSSDEYKISLEDLNAKNSCNELEQVLLSHANESRNAP
jgi:hypothetical protein